MNIVTTPQNWRQTRKTLRGSIGFVPTMGALHAGHESLVTRARNENDIVVVSIFVNPSQFNQPSDFDTYQRTLEADAALLEKAGADYLFAPEAKDMYPENYEVRVTETVLAAELEGAFRPGHFDGVLTVVLKLLNLVRPDRAYFGEKDFQQLRLVQKMARALFLDTDIVPCPVVREESGLALSSRNARLSAADKVRAARLYALLQSDMDDDAVKAALETEGFKPEYVATQWGRRLAAAWLGGVRLIDNVPAISQERKHA